MKALLLIISAWVICAFVLTGLGLLFRRCLRLLIRSAQDALITFWCGFGVLIMALQWWHLAWPVTTWTFIVMTLAGAIGWVLGGKQVLRLCPKLEPALLLWVAVFVGLLLLIADHSLTAPLNNDSGFYHIPTMQWITTYPIVIGLGNVFIFFIYNMSYFLYAAFVQELPPPWGQHASHIANGLLLAVFGAQICCSLYETIKKDSRHSATAIFFSVMMIPLAKELFGMNCSSPAPEISVFILAAIVGGLLLNQSIARSSLSRDSLNPAAKQSPVERCSAELQPGSRQRLAAKPQQAAIVPNAAMPDPERLCSEAIIILWLAMVGITVKLSFASFGAVSVAPALLWGRRYRPARNLPAIALVMCFLLIVPWLIRGALLSGYLVPPLTLFPLPVTWRAPADRIDECMQLLIKFNRTPSRDWRTALDDWAWLAPWLHGILINFYEFVLPMGILLLSGAGFAVLFKKRALRGRCCVHFWLWSLPTVAGLIVWFLFSPDLRLGWPLLWVLSAGVFSYVCSAWPASGTSARVGRLMIVAAAIGMSCTFLVAGKSEAWHALRRTRSLRAGCRLLKLNPSTVIPFGPEAGFYPLPHPTLDRVKTDSGLAIYFAPDNGDCWDSRLPCSPHLNPRLRLRDPDDMAQGFVTD